VPRLTFALLLVWTSVQFGCGVLTTTSSKSGGTNSPSSDITVSVSPNPANVRLGASQQFKATVTGSPNTSVNWFVNGVSGGSAATGMIDSAGMYASPTNLPSPNTATVMAVSAADSNISASIAVTLLNPIPVLRNIAPQTTAVGAFAFTINGANFVQGAQVLFAGSPLNTTFLSSAQLTATGTASSAGTFAITVMNPNPGSASSNSANLQVGQAGGQAGTCSGVSLGEGASLNGFVPFPVDNPWNTNISAAPVDPNSAAIINFIGAGISVHPDFGAGLYQGQSMGIPYLIVGSQQGPVDINFTAYGSESDPGPMPILLSALIEGYPIPGTGDRHVLVLDNSNCWLYELYNAVPSGTVWNAGSAAVWDLTADENRPYTWTSADAAGLPIFPGLARYDEVAGGQINHALRFTLQSSRAAFVPPASHWAANSTNALAAPMGMRLRLKASFDISSFSTANQVILNALKQYGMMMADNGSSMYISGAPDDRWDNNDLHQLSGVTAADFEVVLMNPVYTASNLPQGAAPTINSFTANPSSGAAGTPVTLSWSAAGASYFVISPDVGAIRGTSVVVTPAQTTTYTLAGTNQFGRSTATVTVIVR
jgi:IPT/TIG domain-containing protein